MESNASHSRPPSVDSVHLGSTYSGYFPSMNHHQQQQQQHYPGHHLPQQPNIPPASQYPYQVPYPNGHPASQHQQQSSYQQPYVAGANPTAASFAGLNYQYTMSASAAAQAAAEIAYQRHLQSQQQQQPHASPHLQQWHQFQPIDPQQQTSVNYRQPAVQWPMPALQQQHQPMLQQHPAAGLQQNHQQGQQANDYYSHYVMPYYREFYLNYRRILQHNQQAQVRTKTPLKYGSRLVHARAAFSANDNRLLVVEPNARIAIYNLQEIFTEQIYPHLFLQSLLLHVNDDKSDPESKKTPLPFVDSQVALDWIRAKLLNDSNMNYELKLILKVITMLYRQNGAISGLDLSELLYEIVTGGGSANNEMADSVTDKLSQTGSEQVSQNREQLLGHLRQLLMRGQRRVAITFAQNNGLLEHAVTLSILLPFLSTNGANQTVNNDAITSFRKIISTLESTDPLYVFYTHLLQIAINLFNSSTTYSSAPSACNAKIESLESFIILLANDIKFDKVDITNNSLRNLIDLMVALLKNDLDYVLPDELFNDRFDCLLVNECLEFSRFRGERQNARLLLRKLEFAFELFDYGFVQHALNYCGVIRSKLSDDGLDLKQLQENTTQMKASKFAQFLLPLNSLPGETEEENKEYITNLWLFQIAKMMSRFDAAQAFDSPLINIPEEAEEEDEEETSEEVDGDDGQDEEEELEEEIVPEVVKVPPKKKAELAKVVKAAKAPVEAKVINHKVKSMVAQKKNESKVVEPVVEQEKIVENDSKELSIDNVSTSNLNSTLLNSGSNINNRPSLTSESLPPMASPAMPNHQENHQVMSPIDQSNRMTQGVPQQLRESRIVPSFEANNQMQQQPPSVQPDMNISTGPPQFSNFVATNFAPNPPIAPRLNTIQESFEHQDSFDSSQGGSLPQSPARQPPIASFNYQNEGALNMNSIGNALPPAMPGAIDESSLRRDSVGYPAANSGSNSMGFFAPPPPPVPTFDHTAPFDFMSTGQVTNIPTFDPISLDDNDSVAPNHQSQRNSNEFPNNQQQPNSNQPQQNHTAGQTNNKQESDSTKNSPSKNGGLFSSLFGMIKPKNQAILPDDKEPTIVYDPVLKRWVDKTAPDSGGDGGLPPPPKIPLAGAGARSEPNSTLTSPVNHNSFPTSPSFPSFEPSQMSAPAATAAQSSFPAAPAPVSNGAIPSFSSGFPSVPPSGNTNQFRGGLRKNRYIDVFNAPKSQ